MTNTIKAIVSPDCCVRLTAMRGIQVTAGATCDEHPLKRGSRAALAGDSTAAGSPVQCPTDYKGRDGSFGGPDPADAGRSSARAGSQSCHRLHDGLFDGCRITEGRPEFVQAGFRGILVERLLHRQLP